MPQISSHSCRHRRCSPYARGQVERWLTMQKVRLLVGAHDHIILTILHEFNGLRLADIEGISQLLLASVHHTLLELVGDR